MPLSNITPCIVLLTPPPRPRLRRSSPAPVGGGSSRDIPRKGTSTGKACPGCRPRFRPSPTPSHTPYRGDITRGGARGGNPLPADENHIGPPTGLPRRSGGSRGKSLGGVRPGGGDPYTALLSPPPRPRLRRSSLAPQEGGSSRDIPGKACQGRQPHTPPFPHTIPYTVPWGYHPGRGPGREPPPRQREPYWPSHWAPAPERGFSWKKLGRGASPGCRPQFYPSPAPHHTPLSSPPPRPRRSCAPPPPPPVDNGSYHHTGRSAGSARKNPIIHRRFCSPAFSPSKNLL